MNILAYTLSIIGSVALMVLFALFVGAFIRAGKGREHEVEEAYDLLVYTAPRNMVAAINNLPVTLYEGDKIVEHKYGRTVVRWMDFDRLVEQGEIVRHAEADDGDWFKGYRARSLFAIEAQQAVES